MMHNPGLRIANCSGFWPDRLSAAREMVEGGPIDFLTGDYLAELTLLIMWKSKQRDPSLGYATIYLRQMEEVLGTCLDRGIKIVTNAGGLNPASLARKMAELTDRLGLQARISHIEGDDILDRIPRLQSAGMTFAHLDTGRTLAEAGVKPVAANAYLGARGIVEALNGGADVVICPRVTDASLVVGPAAYHFGWQFDDWDRLAGAVVAGHIIECGTQATGGNYSFFQEVPGLERLPGFPIAEMFDDGSSVITKHPGTGGAVSVGTVTAQVLYEIGTERYLNPDVVARFDTICLEQEGADRVRVSGVRGEPAPETTKVCINYLGGFRSSRTFLLTGLDIEEKAHLLTNTLFTNLGGRDQFDDVDVQLIRTDHPDPIREEVAEAQLRINIKDRDQRKVDKAFSTVSLGLANYPGFHGGGSAGASQSFGVYWPALVPRSEIHEVVVAADGSRREVHADRIIPEHNEVLPYRPTLPPVPSDPTVKVPLGTVFGARSGDKGGNANVGVWARSDAGYVWLESFLTVERFKELFAEARDLEVLRTELPNLRSLNFVIIGLLGEGVASSTRVDPQAKAAGEYLRAKLVDLPMSLLADAPKSIASSERAQ